MGPRREPPGPPRRGKPAEGVRIDPARPTIVFVTVCTKDRRPWLANDEAHGSSRQVWQQAAAWWVGRYVLMPDHLHLFAAPQDLMSTLESWLRYWKSRFSRSHPHADWTWQANAFHHRLRNDEGYGEKWRYVKENPVRAGLVDDSEEWRFQGEIFPLRW